MTNRELRLALLKKLDVTPQALSQRAQRLKKQYPMSTEQATYVIAHREGIPLDHYLPTDVLGDIRQLVLQTSGNQGTSKAAEPVRKSRVADGRTVVISKEFKGTDPILPEKVMLEAKQMAAIYPLLYVLENSVRELIRRAMTAQFGSDWWDIQASARLKKTVADRMKDEERNSWHQRRGAHPIDYLDLDQLTSLVRNGVSTFVPRILPSVEWFDGLISEVYQSRCVLCHMNPLSDDNIQRVKLRFRDWQRQIREKMTLIPTLDIPSSPPSAAPP